MIRFGLFQPMFEIFADRVVVTRRAALSYVMLAMLVPGVVLIALSNRHHHLRMETFVPGSVLGLCGMMSVMMTPWLTPARLELSHRGLACGNTLFAPAQVRSIDVSVTIHRSGPGKKYASWAILIVAVGATPRAVRLDCGNHAPWTKPTLLEDAARELKRVLWDAQHRPAIRQT